MAKNGDRLMPSEFQIIKKYFQPLSTIKTGTEIKLNTGDDCAVVTANGDQLFSIDTQLAGVHFFEDMPAHQIAHRGFVAALSDLAAMGAKPEYFTLALTLPRTVSELWLHNYAKGLQRLAEKFNCPLLGGDTTAGNQLVQTFQVHGSALNGDWVTRTGAQAGEHIYVSGYLGMGAGGLALREQKFDEPKSVLEGYINPMPQIELGQQLVGKASAMIDVSDGLLADLKHICEASSVAAEVWIRELPLHTDMIQRWGLDMVQNMALSGGDDYQLCFTAKPEDLDASFCQQWHITQIGRVLAADAHTPTVRCINPDGSERPPLSFGYQHF